MAECEPDELASEFGGILSECKGIADMVFNSAINAVPECANEYRAKDTALRMSSLQQAATTKMDLKIH